MSNAIAGPAQPAKPRVDTSRVGFVGLRRFRGLIAEEYVPELSSARAVDLYAKMRSDGMVEAITRALKLPIMAASWVVEPASKTDANAAKARDLVEEVLFNRLGLCWEETVRECLTYLQYGFGVQVKQWAVEKGLAVLADLMPVHPRTAVQGGRNWEFDPETGALVGLWQYGTDGVTWRQELIPRERFAHFVHDGDFRNPEGRSIYRSAYKHWLVKDTLYRIEAIGLERGAVGVPVMEYDPDSNDTDLRNKLETFGNGLMAYENGYLIVPKGTAVNNFQLQVNTESLHAAISHHDTKIAQCVLAQWLQLGVEGKGGAYALSSDQTDHFMLCLETVGDYLCAVINREVIPELVSYNLATDQFPRLSATVSRTSAAALGALARQMTAGVNPPLTWSEADEDWLREYMQLPARTEPRAARVDPAATATPPGRQPPVGDKPAAPEQMNRPERIHLRVFADPPRFKEQPTYPAQGQVIDEMLAGLRDAGERLRKAMWRAASLPQQAAARFNAGDAAPMALTDAQKTALDDAIAQFLAEFAGDGQDEAGFVSAASEDGLLQSYLRLGHAVGVDRATELTQAQTAAFAPARESPQIRKLLTDAFQRLSTNGQLKIGAKLDAIRDVIVSGVGAGKSAFDVAGDLTEAFDGLAGYDFERLARTEMAFASNAGSADEWRAEGVTEFDPVISALACPICTAYAGTVLGPDGDLPPWHPNCLCSLAPRVADRTAEQTLNRRALRRGWLGKLLYNENHDERGRFAPGGAHDWDGGISFVKGRSTSDLDKIAKEATSHLGPESTAADCQAAFEKAAAKAGVGKQTLKDHNNDLYEWTQNTTGYEACRLMAAENKLHGQDLFHKFIGDELADYHKSAIEQELTTERMTCHAMQHLVTEHALIQTGVKEKIILRGDRRHFETGDASAITRSLSSWSASGSQAASFAEEHGTVMVAVAKAHSFLATHATSTAFRDYPEQKEFVLGASKGRLYVRTMRYDDVNKDNVKSAVRDLRTAGQLFAKAPPEIDLRGPGGDEFLRKPAPRPALPRDDEDYEN